MALIDVFHNNALWVHSVKPKSTMLVLDPLDAASALSSNIVLEELFGLRLQQEGSWGEDVPLMSRHVFFSFAVKKNNFDVASLM